MALTTKGKVRRWYLPYLERYQAAIQPSAVTEATAEPSAVRLFSGPNGETLAECKVACKYTTNPYQCCVLDLRDLGHDRANAILALTAVAAQEAHTRVLVVRHVTGSTEARTLIVALVERTQRLRAVVIEGESLTPDDLCKLLNQLREVARERRYGFDVYVPYPSSRVPGEGRKRRAPGACAYSRPESPVLGWSEEEGSDPEFAQDPDW